MKTRVSVIIPVYNVQEFLEECLDSVVGQTINNLELCDGYKRNLQIILVDTIDGGGGVVVAVDKLSCTLNQRTDGFHIGAAFLDGFIVGEFQRLHGGGILTHTATHVGTRTDHDHVGAHLRDVGLDTPLRSLTDGKHGDYRGNADDDAKSGEKRTGLVGSDGAKGNLE